jgi:hypothetical protein
MDTASAIVAGLLAISQAAVGADGLQGNGPEQAATDALAEFTQACGTADTAWSVPLCGRLVLIDPQIRIAVATHPDPARTFRRANGAYVGRWPEGRMVANTGFDWDGERWAMAMLPLSQDAFHRLRLLAHESFHRIQPELGLTAEDPPAVHLDELEGRLWLRMELRALAQALESEGEAALASVRDALMFRAWRQSRFDSAERSETRLEANEGLAEYAGIRFALDATGEPVTRAAEFTRGFEKRESYVRALGYGTGPALGLLLDRYSPGWRTALPPAPTLADSLAEALDITTATPSEAPTTRAARYGYAAVLAEEQARSREREAMLARYRARLVEGPVLDVPGTPDLKYGFDPNAVVPFGDLGTVFPMAFFEDAWGRMHVAKGGVLLSAGRDRLRVAAPPGPFSDNQPVLEGPDWTLELSPGWMVAPGPREGDYRVVPE